MTRPTRLGIQRRLIPLNSRLRARHRRIPPCKYPCTREKTFAICHLTITGVLLSSPCFNKLFEILLWKRIEPWWKTNHIISNLQGAARKGHSCVNLALLLQEALYASITMHNKCFVAYFDVSKAFETVWVNGLFFRLYQMGIIGRTWRLLYKCYQNLLCKVCIQGLTSDWYPLECGIHQGGYLSLSKYMAFIDSLVSELTASNLCSKFLNIPSSPVSYADDLATKLILARAWELDNQLCRANECINKNTDLLKQICGDYR